MPTDAPWRNALSLENRHQLILTQQPWLQHPGAPPKALQLLAEEIASLDDFVAEPRRRQAALSWPGSQLNPVENSEQTFAHKRLQERRFAAQQVRRYGFRLPQAARSLAIRAQDLFSGPKGSGMIPPNVSIIGDVTSEVLSPHAVFPQNMFVAGSLHLDAKHLRSFHPAFLPQGLTVTYDIHLTCREHAPSFVLGHNTAVGRDLIVRKNKRPGFCTEPSKQFWDLEALGDLDVWGNMILRKIACKLGPNSHVARHVAWLGCRLPSLFPKMSIGGSLECNCVVGLTQLGSLHQQVTVNESAMLAGCPDLVQLDGSTSFGMRLSLYGNARLTALPEQLHLRGDLILIGNRIAHIPDYTCVEGLIVHNEPLRCVGRNVVVLGQMFFLNLPYCDSLGSNLFVNGNLSVYACPQLTRLPASLPSWPLTQKQLSNQDTLLLQREVRLHRTGISMRQLRHIAGRTVCTRLIPFDDDHPAARDEVGRTLTHALSALRDDCYPIMHIDVTKHQELECPVTLDTLPELLARGCAVALGSPENPRVYDFNAFVKAWLLDGRDPATRQLLTPYELQHVVPLT